MLHNFDIVYILHYNLHNLKRIFQYVFYLQILLIVYQYFLLIIHKFFHMVNHNLHDSNKYYCYNYDYDLDTIIVVVVRDDDKE